MSTLADFTDPTRLADWTLNTSLGSAGIGVPDGMVTRPTGGGVTINVTQSPYNADNTGATDATSALQAAIDAASAGDKIYLPAGTYKCLSGLLVQQFQRNFSIVGDGIGQTIIDSHSADGWITIGQNGTWNFPNVAVTAGLTQGSTSITVTDGSNFTVGDLIRIGFSNREDPVEIAAGKPPIVSVVGFDLDTSQPILRQINTVVGKSSNTLTLGTPLLPVCDDLDATVNLRGVSTGVAPHAGVGLEGMTIDCTNGNNSVPIFIQQTIGTWVYKVKVIGNANTGKPIHIEESYRCEIGHCWFIGNSAATAGHAGIHTQVIANCYVYNNVVEEIFPGFEINDGSLGNVFAYNFVVNVVEGLCTNHAPHNGWNLYEGNIALNVINDGYFGGGSDDTFLRNWFTGVNTDGQLSYTQSFKRFTRNQSMIGNVMGKSGTVQGAYDFGDPNRGNGADDGTNASPLNGDFWKDWLATATLTTRTTDNSGVVTVDSPAVPAAPATQFQIWWGYNPVTTVAFCTVSSVVGQAITFTTPSTLPAASTALRYDANVGGYQEHDSDTEWEDDGGTTVLKDNYLFATGGIGGGIPAGEVSGLSLPDSGYLSGKPTWFGSLAWPPISSHSTGSMDYEMIPAGYAWLNGDWPAESAGGTLTCTKFACSVLKIT